MCKSAEPLPKCLRHFQLFLLKACRQKLISRDDPAKKGPERAFTAGLTPIWLVLFQMVNSGRVRQGSPVGNPWLENMSPLLWNKTQYFKKQASQHEMGEVHLLGSASVGWSEMAFCGLMALHMVSSQQYSHGASRLPREQVGPPRPLEAQTLNWHMATSTQLAKESNKARAGSEARD
jgi:hypothetical protein